MVRAITLLSLVLGAAAFAPDACVKTGAECTGDKSCCDASSKCEAVNSFYSKCVNQPKCAAKNGQCAGKGDSVMEKVPCCDEGFVCKVVNEWYSSCVNSSSPVPPPPSPTPSKNCSDTGAQCGGQGAKTTTCCAATAQCETVNKFYAKCVDQPKCSADNSICAGSGDHVFKTTACCDASGHHCVPWGDEWSVCRKSGEEKCSAHGEQCAGTGGSAMKEKACCDPDDKCTVVNKYYSKCDKPSVAGLLGTVRDSCPGLVECPSDDE